METFNVLNLVGKVVIHIELAIPPMVCWLKEVRSGLSRSDVFSEDVFPFSVRPSSFHQILQSILLLLRNVLHEELLRWRWQSFGMWHFVVLSTRNHDFNFKQKVVAISHFFDVLPPHRQVREDPIQLVVGSFKRFDILENLGVATVLHLFADLMVVSVEIASNYHTVARVGNLNPIYDGEEVLEKLAGVLGFVGWKVAVDQVEDLTVFPVSGI